MGPSPWSLTRSSKLRPPPRLSWSLLWSLLLSTSWWTSVRAQQGRYHGYEVWSLLMDHYGELNGSWIGFSLQVSSFYNNTDLLQLKIKHLKSTRQLRDLCRYVTPQSCRPAHGGHNSQFLFIVRTLNEECCGATAVTTASAPVNGVWGGWGTWSTCSVTCGQGTRSRSRQCDSPPPSGRGQYCPGNSVQLQRCLPVTCRPTDPPEVHGTWGGWGVWSTCSATCGLGTRSRSRQCDRRTPSGGGHGCGGDDVQKELCQAFVTCRPTAPPVVHGTWGGWGGWSSCSVTCGQGTRSRSRQCDSPAPSGGGQRCVGEGVQGQQCQLVTCPPEGRQCSQTRYEAAGRVMGGSRAPRGGYPWLVHLVISGSIKCAGVIVDTRHVLTAGHCLAERIENAIVNSNDLEVIAGNYERSLVLEPNAQRISVVSGIRHHNYDPLYLTNDVAVLKLAEPLQFNDDVSNVCLPSQTDTLPSTCTVAGWGSLSYSNNFPQQLQQVELSVYNNTTCQRLFDSTTSYDISHFLMGGVMCAANGTSGGKDSCRGDSGSGLMCLASDAQGNFYKLFGLVSSGFGCGRPGQPGYYAYLPFYVDWITETIDSLQ